MVNNKYEKKQFTVSHNYNFLPPDKNKVKTIALMGPNAFKYLPGDYLSTPRVFISRLDAIKEKYGSNIKILYAEVLQMYIRDNYSSVARPVKELKSFKKIWLDPGQSQTVSIEINPELLSFYDKDMKWILEPGDFTIMVGGSSDKAENIKLTVLK